MPQTIQRARPDEYGTFYETYVGKVPAGGNVAELLACELETTRALLASVPAGRETWTYAEGKWSFRQVAGHLADSERVFSFRALHIARGDAAELPGMDQEVWTAGSNAAERPLPEILEEWAAVRAATVRLFAGLPEAALDRRGVASGMEVSVRGLASIVLGHELHHRAVLRERYLLGGTDG